MIFLTEGKIIAVPIVRAFVYDAKTVRYGALLGLMHFREAVLVITAFQSVGKKDAARHFAAVAQGRAGDLVVQGHLKLGKQEFWQARAA